MSKKELTAADQALYDEILCIADTKLVLAGWHMITLPNGRAVADWNAICGMMQAHYGHARALYAYLSRFGLSRADAEWNRSEREIRSPEILDKPPQSWADLIMSTYLVERALSTILASHELGGPDGELAGLAAHISRETEFHFSYTLGWLKVLAATQAVELHRCAAERFESVTKWWGPVGADDPALLTGRRKVSRNEMRAEFLRRATLEVADCGIALARFAPSPGPWDARTMRSPGSGLPKPLFELIRFKNTELAMP